MAVLTRLSEEQRTGVIRDVTAEAVPRSSFYVLVLLSTAIAAYGLLANSTAVVIGAMLIAPLMGPIYGIALGLIRDDRRLLLFSGLSEAVGIVLAIGLAVLIGALPLRPDFGTEILLRTKPNLYDLLVAIIAGIAGAFARTSERLSPTLPGVAIATALVPPLAVCGLCLSDARWDAALGAFLLFATNLLAIEIAAGAVFVAAGLTARGASDGRTVVSLLRRFAVPVVLLIPIAAFLLQTLVTLVGDDRLSRNLRLALGDDMRSVLGAEVTEVQHERRGEELDVVAIVLTPQPIEPALVSTTEDDLRRRVDPRVHLIVRSLISRDEDKGGQVFLDERVRQRLQVERQRQSFLNALSTGLRSGLDGVRGAELIEVHREQRDSLRIRATVRAPVVIDPHQVSLIQKAAVDATGLPIRLFVRSVLTREADDRTYVDEDEQAVSQQRAREALERILAGHSPDAEVLSVRTAAPDEGEVTATVVGLRPPSPRSIEQLNRELTEALGRRTLLTLRVVRTADAVASRGDR